MNSIDKINVDETFLEIKKLSHNLESMKIVLLGSEGMLGSDLAFMLEEYGFDVVTFTHVTLDITSQSDVQSLECLKPDIVINCAAYTQVDNAEDDFVKCYRVNTEAVILLTNLCKKIGSTFIQISTDYVFDGDAGNYDELAIKNPLSVYGKSKADAEDIIQKSLEKYFIVRTSWLYGEYGNNFVETVLRVCGDKGEMLVVNDQTGCPTYVKDLSRGIVELLDKPYGIYHLTNNPSCTWYEFATEIVIQSNTTCIVTPCTSSEYPQKAMRPKSSVLLNTKTNQLRPWKEALKDYLRNKKIS